MSFVILSLSKDDAARAAMIETIHVYILRCSDGSFYTGLTTAGLDRRVAEHNAGIYGGYTSSRRPVQLVWADEFQRMDDAIACERRVKGWRRAKKEAPIKGNFELLSRLSRTAGNRPGSTSSP